MHDFALLIFLEFIVVGFPLFLLACIKTSIKPLIAAGFFLLVFGFNSIASFYFPVTFGQAWEFKAFEFVWPCILVYLCKWVSPTEAGFIKPSPAIAFFWGAMIGIFFAVLNLLEMIFSQDFPFSNRPISTLIFQFTMPGLGEEIVYRGILLAILNHYLGKPWVYFKMKFGWGVILISIFFAFIHVLKYSSTDPTIFLDPKTMNYKIFPQILAFSFILGFIREKTGSVWPGVICHNLMNGLSYAGIWGWATFL